MEATNLSADAWADAGLAALASHGAGALKADRLAKALGVSRGSFYWHFRDVADFRRAVLARWRATASEDVIAGLERQADPREALRDLLARAFKTSPRLEAAIRAWASHDAAVRAAVAAADRRRTASIRDLIARAGASGEVAEAQARLLYWTFLGFVTAADPPAREARARLAAELARMAGLG
jgi:AcrR family transcriptional regulator